MAKTTPTDMTRIGTLITKTLHKTLKLHCKAAGMKEGAFVRFAIQEKLGKVK